MVLVDFEEQDGPVRPFVGEEADCEVAQFGGVLAEVVQLSDRVVTTKPAQTSELTDLHQRPIWWFW